MFLVKNIEVSRSKLLNLLTMKNFKRLLLIIALVFVASKVLSSDFELIKSEDNNTAIVSK
ncbi:hypothetical protein GCM10007028_22240 [Algibacter mikhailovii]|uniref:Uncharacterized protein n=1 Tax=Algibacter mikhailovii TaxID=425498 RepID=A0A918VAK9_9FLAO|nr:hypothetical protein GCM10007028_22240 [Algibacter mikhailovii]